MFDIKHAFIRSAAASASVLSLIAAATPAIAQDQAPAANQASASEDQDSLDIVVVARKREESAQTVPISITALTGGQLAEQRVQRVTDLIGKVPNMTSDGGGNILGAIGLRGVVSIARNIGFDSGLGVYVDGVLTVRPSSANQELPDIASVEVLRGPQGTLFGRNTTAGAINILTRRASLGEPAGDVTVGIGNLGIREVSAFMTAPLVEDKLGFKISGYSNNRDGYIYNQTLDRHENSIHHSGVRGGLRWKATDTLEIAANGSYARQQDRQLRGQLLDNVTGTLAGQPGVFLDPYVVQQDNPSYQNISSSLGSLHVDWTLPNDMTLTSISAYGKVTSHFQNDDDARPIKASASTFNDASRQFTQELRLASKAGGAIDYLVGAYYFYQKSHADRSTYVNASTLGFITSESALTTNAYAVFASGNYRPADQIEISAGIRYNQEKKSTDFAQQDTSVTRLPTIATSQSRSDDAVTGNVSVTYKIAPSFRVYGSASRGFKSGGFNVDIVSTPDISFGPEHVWTYEAGVKSEPFGGRAHVNVAVFKSDFGDLQVSQLNGNAFQIRNAGSSGIKGAELEIAARPVRNLDLNVGAGYTDAKFKRFDNCAANTSCAGRFLPYVPKWTLNAGLGYKIELAGESSLNYRIDWTYRSRLFYDIYNRPTSRTEGYQLVDSRVSYALAGGRYGAALFVKNLFDKRYNDYAFFLAPYRQPKISWAVPRTYGVELFAHF